MKKLIAICFAAALLMQSCSTGNMFSHKRYGHLKWVDHDTKVETKGKDSESAQVPVTKKTENTVITEEKKSLHLSEENSSAVNKEEIAENSQPAMVKQCHTVADGKNVSTTDVVVDETQSINEVEEINLETNAPKLDDVKEIKDTKEGSTGELLLMALLIALALILFFLLDSALGGILTLVLAIFLILVILRYFGVI